MERLSLIALTGPEADKANGKAELLCKRFDNVKGIIEDPKCTLNQKDMVKLITDLTDDISAATISYWRKDELRTKLKGLKKTIDDRDKARKAKVLTEIVEYSKKLIEMNKEIPYMVIELDAYAQNKALDGALKQVKALSPVTAAMFISADTDTGKVLCMAQVLGAWPKSLKRPSPRA